MDKQYFDISLIITFHSEGNLAHPTLRCAFGAVAFAQARGVSVELIAVLDAPTAATRDYFARYRSDPAVRVLDVEYRNASEPRNHGVRVARGRWVALLDGDDLITRSWLYNAHAKGQEFGAAPVALIHQYSLLFGAESWFLSHPSSADPWLRREALVENNYWTTPAVLAPRQLLLDLPHWPTPASGGFGYEDWHHFTALLSRGVPIVPVPETVLFVRRKATGSNLQAYVVNDTLMPPSPLLHPLVYGRWDARPAAPEPAEPEPAPPATRAPQTDAPPPDEVRPAPAGPGRLVRLGIALATRFPRLAPLLVRAYHTLHRRGVLRAPAPVPPAPVREAPGESARVPPACVRAACAEIRAIEPLIYPDHELWASIREYRVPPPNTAPAYGLMCAAIRAAATHVFLVPWLKRGGSDLETINYVRLVAGRVGPDRVVVIATEDADSPWAERLPRGVTFINFRAIVAGIDETSQRRLLATFLVQLGPEVVHNLNSRIGYEAFVRHGRALRQRFRLFTSVFCVDQSVTGRPVGYLVSYLPQCAEHLSGVLGDNRRVLDWVRDTHGIDERFLHAHAHPIELRPRTRRTRSPGAALNVLWAGRLDRQKRADVLVEVARRAAHLPVRFHAYGSSLLHADQVVVDFARVPNLTYHGPFDGFERLPTDRFDLFLNTSEWDGLPNVLLEALSAGLAVLSSDVGGIGELIEDGRTGLLVAPFDDAAGYVRRLERLCADPGQLEALVEAGRERVAERHNWSEFARAVARVPGYLPPAPGGQPGGGADAVRHTIRPDPLGVR